MTPVPPAAPSPAPPPASRRHQTRLHVASTPTNLRAPPYFAPCHHHEPHRWYRHQPRSDARRRPMTTAPLATPDGTPCGCASPAPPSAAGSVRRDPGRQHYRQPRSSTRRSAGRQHHQQPRSPMRRSSAPDATLAQRRHQPRSRTTHDPTRQRHQQPRGSADCHHSLATPASRVDTHW